MSASDRSPDCHLSAPGSLPATTHLSSCLAPDLFRGKVSDLNVRLGSEADAHLGRCDVRFASITQTFSNSLLSAMLFPVCNKKFPVPIAGNSSKNVPRFNGSLQAGRGVSTEIPCIFPRIREFRSRDAFAAASQHSHPVSAFLALYRPSPTVPKKPGNAPPEGYAAAGGEESRDAVQCERVQLPVHFLSRPVLGVTLSDLARLILDRRAFPS